MKETQQYLDFVDKFKAKKTTDDCYTPDNIMNAIISWVGENLQPLERAAQEDKIVYQLSEREKFIISKLN